MRRLLPALLLGLLLPVEGAALPMQAPLVGAPPLDPHDRVVPPGPPPGLSLPVVDAGILAGPPIVPPAGPPAGVPPVPDAPPPHGTHPLLQLPPVNPPLGPPSAVPEPGTMLLLLGGLVGLGLGGRART